MSKLRARRRKLIKKRLNSMTVTGRNGAFLCECWTKRLYQSNEQQLLGYTHNPRSQKNQLSECKTATESSHPFNIYLNILSFLLTYKNVSPN